MILEVIYLDSSTHALPRFGNELESILHELNLKQYLRDDKNKEISLEQLEYFYDSFKLKGYAKYDKNPALIPELEALKLLEILLLPEAEFINRYVNVEEVQPISPLVPKERRKKTSNITRKDKSEVLPEPVIVPQPPAIPPSKNIQEMTNIYKKMVEPPQEQWVQKMNVKLSDENFRTEPKELEEPMELEDFDERPQSPSEQINIQESRTYRALKVLAEAKKIDAYKFDKFSNIVRIRYYIKLRDRIKTTDLKIAKAQYNSIKEDIESYDYTNSNVKSADRMKQYVINKVLSNLPLCKFILNSNGEPATTGDLNRYAEFLGIGSIDYLPKEIKCFLVLREIIRDEIDLLKEYFKEISY